MELIDNILNFETIFSVKDERQDVSRLSHILFLYSIAIKEHAPTFFTETII